MSGIQKLLGDKVVNNAGEDVNVSSFTGKGKVVGLYFSAHWCPPCRGFTPKLATFYNDLKKKDKGKDFEIVFLSSDKDESAFKEYFGEMPWKALPFSDRDRKTKLSKKFGIKGIPSFIILDGETGNIITADGRSEVDDDPTGEKFPWHVKPLGEIVKGKLLAKDGKEVDAEAALSGKVKAIYFSAYWCPPCRGFTPKLIETYNKIKKDGKNFEILFASSDRDENQFKEYFGTMPWLAFPLKDERVGQLNKLFDIEGIPSLIIIDENDKVITKNGRSALAEDSEGKNFPWRPKPVEKLTSNSASVLNEYACMVLLTEGDKSEALAQEVLSEAAKEYFDKREGQDDKEEEQDVFFLWMDVDAEEEMYDSLKSFCKLDDRLPLLALIDIPERRHFSSPEKTITKEVVSDIIAKYKKNELDWKNI